MKETYENAWRKYTSAWSEPEKEKRMALLKEALENNSMYQDQHNELMGISQLVDYMAVFQESMPGAYFELNDFKTHHDKSLAKWTLMNCSGEKIHEGISFGVYTSKAKLQQMTGFFF